MSTTTGSGLIVCYVDKSCFTRDCKFVWILAAAGVEGGRGCRVESLLLKDSLDMDDAGRAAVVQAVVASSETRVVIVYSTDTAVALNGQVGDKVVALVGAMHPAVFTGSDAAFNLGHA